MPYLSLQYMERNIGLDLTDAKSFKVPMQRNYLIFYCFSKKYCWSDEDDVYSFVISHLILKISHFLYFEL